MTNQELQRLVEHISLESLVSFSSSSLVQCQAADTGGRYQLKDHSIEINPKMLTDYGEATLVGIIKHELCHYHLHLAGNLDNTAHGRFENCCNRSVVAVCTGTKIVQPNHAAGNCMCQHCGQKYYRARRIDVSKMVCGRCHGRLVWQKTVVAVQRPR